MKLALSLGYWGSQPPAHAPALFAQADEWAAAGLFDSIWTSEAYGSDALTPLAWWGSATQHLKLGTNIAQMSARTPTAMAMAALTLDHLSQGRFILGLGVSGPQVVEGWYGQDFARPLARTREYVDIVRQVLRREAPVTNPEPQYPLPRPGSVLGKPLMSTVHPLRPELPIYLAAEGPKNIALAAEIADGWLAAFCSPDHDDIYRECLAAGFAARGARHTLDSFQIVASVPTAVRPTVAEAADALRPHVALYVGGMGAKEANFHSNSVARLGFERECAAIQERYLAGDKRGAAAAVTVEMVDAIALIGPSERIAERLTRYESSLAQTIIIQGDLESVAAVAATQL